MATEQYYFVDANGASFQIAFTGSRVLQGLSGAGMADVEHFTQRIPSQHRSLHLGYKFKPRYLTFRIADFADDRDEMWDHHQDWLDAFNPVLGEGYIRMILSDGTERRLDCLFNDGLKFDSDDRHGPFTQGDIVQVMALDPFWYDPEQESESGSFVETPPPTEITLDNVGHVESYPVITITGPVNNPKLTLVTTGEFIQFDYNLTEGHHLDIDCGEGTVTLDDALMYPLKLTKASTLFYIPRGAEQPIQLTATSGTGLVTIKWYSRFLGI